MTLNELLYAFRDGLAVSHLLPCTMSRDVTDDVLLDTFRRCPECQQELVTREVFLAMAAKARSIDDLESALEILDAAHECPVPITMRPVAPSPWSLV